mmetsp:Transcript_15229/g.36221  ORF Transcript_15229/g.36221 Transcript_15229/m.36221 type:complete len:263 (+) Transcript_15229:454-1242(+)
MSSPMPARRPRTTMQAWRTRRPPGKRRRRARPQLRIGMRWAQSTRKGTSWQRTQEPPRSWEAGRAGRLRRPSRRQTTRPCTRPTGRTTFGGSLRTRTGRPQLWVAKSSKKSRRRRRRGGAGCPLRDHQRNAGPLRAARMAARATALANAPTQPRRLCWRSTPWTSCGGRATRSRAVLRGRWRPACSGWRRSTPAAGEMRPAPPRQRPGTAAERGPAGSPLRQVGACSSSGPRSLRSSCPATRILFTMNGAARSRGGALSVPR